MTGEGGDTEMNSWSKIFLGFLSLAACLTPAPVRACHDGSPLILDLAGKGVITTGLDDPVPFDLDADGELELVAWTIRGEYNAFLWVDLNRNGSVDDGGELFGTATRMPDGQLADNGFEALAIYDREELGGDGDGVISPGDLVWSHLLLWVDENHDGYSEQAEIRRLGQSGVISIALDYTKHPDDFDAAGNLHLYQGRFAKRVTREGAAFVRLQALTDVFLKIHH
jgi:hypothetical protein